MQGPSETLCSDTGYRPMKPVLASVSCPRDDNCIFLIEYVCGLNETNKTCKTTRIVPGM